MIFKPPPSFTSTQVLAEFYRRARNAEIEIFLDYESRTNTGRKCRFNAVVVKGDRILAIVACKRSPNAARGTTRQKTRYESFGVPVIWVRGMDRVQTAVEAAKRLFEADNFAADDAWLKEFE